MEKKEFFINNIPAVSYGEKNERGILFIHGLCGNKFEAEFLAETAVPKGWQVTAVDLPEHGERRDGVRLLPWNTVPELTAVGKFMKERHSQRMLMAVSIGAYMSLLAFGGTEFAEKSLLVSPVVDMENIILNMMKADGVTEDMLCEKGEIPSSSGQMLSWEYLCYVRNNPIKPVCVDTSILYGENDCLIPKNIITDFADRNEYRLTVMDDGEHWFHTERQLAAMKKWLESELS